MPRRREFANVADGVSGHFIRDTPWDRDWWPLGGIGRAYLRGFGDEFNFDMVNGTVRPETGELRAIARALRSDIDRHLAARRLPAEWLQTATLHVNITPSPQTRKVVLVTCRVTIIDDRGFPHTSTRRASAPLPWLGPVHWAIDLITRRTGEVPRNIKEQ